jgi:hypothetical protein
MIWQRRAQLVPGSKRESAQAGQNPVILTESPARKYSEGQSASGGFITLNTTRPLKVTGVVKDVPVNTHLSFRDWFPIPLPGRKQGAVGVHQSWLDLRRFTGQNVSPPMESPATGLPGKTSGERAKETRYLLQPLTDIRFDTCIATSIPSGTISRQRSLFTRYFLFRLWVLFRSPSDVFFGVSCRGKISADAPKPPDADPPFIGIAVWPCADRPEMVSAVCCSCSGKPYTVRVKVLFDEPGPLVDLKVSRTVAGMAVTGSCGSGAGEPPAGIPRNR